ncbi:MAG TPA: MBL fold metallo-hydrolase [Anaerolineae bacterium]|nr:MBL fold metallo-hydrolase [Anaerolineae bacterium]
MPRLIVLGSAAAVHDAVHENTYLVLASARESILIDCAGNPIGRLQRAGTPVEILSSVIITHNHPDHTYGLPILLMDLWLLGRTQPLRIYAPSDAINALRLIMVAHKWDQWPNFYPVEFIEIPVAASSTILKTEDFIIASAPGNHFVPVVGLRVTNCHTGYSVMYTSDTSPIDSLTQLAQGVNLLFHDTAGDTLGHSSARMAGRMAREAQVEKLILIHYPVDADPAALVADAQSEFTGPIEVAQDFAEYFI